MSNKKRIFSGVQPSGNLTLGNYLGALRNFGLLQDDYDCLYCVVDLHSITVRQDPELLRERSYAVLALYLACGLDPDKNVLFLQSQVSGHAELGWALNCYTYMGELNRMTQFKDKSQKHADNINGGLYTYPVLMAADILLYNADMVPIGQDQKQHLELARNVAERFNKIYGDTFVIPEPFIPKTGARVMSLQDPTKKMSKSDDNVNNFILITEGKDKIIKKFKKAVTDSGNEIIFDEENKPGISNLIKIYASITSKTVEEVQKEFENSRYGDFKMTVGNAVADTLEPIRIKYEELMQDKAYLDSVFKKGAERAKSMAEPMIDEVYRKIGFLR